MIDNARQRAAIVAVSAALGTVLMSRASSAADLQVIAPLRAACEAALDAERADGKGHGARESCHRVSSLSAAPEDMRNEVASIMSPARQPSMDDMALSLLVVDAAIRKASDQPWPHLARCDVARRLGSADGLAVCRTDLETMARRHPATPAALASIASPISPGGTLARLALAALLLGTLFHSLRSRRRSRAALDPTSRPALAGRPGPGVAALVLAAASLLAVRPASADTAAPRDRLSDFVIDDADPESSIPDAETQNRKPLEFGYFLQDLAAKAEAAQKRDDHAAAARFFRAFTKATPRSAYGPRKLCAELESLGDVQGAIVACRTALTREGTTVDDYSRFVDLALARKGALAPLERKEIEAVIAHLEKEAPGVVPAKLHCALAVRVQDRKALDTCTATLAKTAADDPQTVSFQWALAVMKGDRRAATHLIERARGLGMKPEALAQMERATNELQARRFVRAALWGLGLALFAVLAALALRAAAGRRRSSAPFSVAPPAA